MNNFFNRTIQLAVLICIFSVSVISCRKFYDPELVFEEYGVDTSSKLERKVLIIAVDGVAGSELNTLSPKNIKALQSSGKYTYSLKPQDTTRASFLASIINGVSGSKHKIIDSSFIARDDHQSEDHESLPSFPTMFTYLLQYKQKLRTAVVTGWSSYQRFLRIADKSVYVSSDALVTDSSVNIIKNTPALGAMLVNFNEVDIAGKNGGYKITNNAYKTALERVDVYIGDILQAIKSRSNYSKEDWLIMVASGYAGSGSDLSDGFMIVSNPKLKEYEVKKVGFSTVKFGWDESSSRVSAKLKNEGDLYNSGADKEFTAQISVRFDVAKSWPGFFGKTSGVSGGTVTGWTMTQTGAALAAMYGGSANGTAGKGQMDTDIQIVTGGWKTLTMTVKKEGNTRRMRLYVDGVTNNPAGVDLGNRNFNTTAPFTIGYIKVDGSGDSEFYAADALYFNKALDEATIKSNLNIQDIKKHTEYASITGYWPLDDGFGPVMENKAPGAKGIDFVLNGPYRWRAMNDMPPPSRNIGNLNDPSIIASIYDIPSIMLYWLNIEARPDWGLDGSAWLRSFDKEIYLQ